MRNLKKKLTLQSGKQLIAWEFSCTYRPENKVILHFQSFKRLINSVLFPMTTTLIQVNFVLAKNCWNNVQNKKQELNLLFPQPSVCCILLAIPLNSLLVLLTSLMTNKETPSKTNTPVILYFWSSEGIHKKNHKKPTNSDLKLKYYYTVLALIKTNYCSFA